MRQPFQSNFIELSGGLRYHYLDEGPRTPGRAVLMLHGNPTWSFLFRNLVLALRGEHRCVVPDHIGCGLSDKPQNYAYMLAQHAANLEVLAERLELREITLVLHDWGGAIGMGLARRKPACIKRLVIFNTAAFTSLRIPWRIALCRVPLLGALAIRGCNLFARGAVRMAAERPLSAEAKEGLLFPYDSWANRIALLRFVQDIPMSPAHRTWEELKAIEAALPQFADRPTLICWGMRDWCFDESFLTRWQALFPKASVHKFTRAGHYLLEDAPEEITPLVRQFLGNAGILPAA